MAGLISCNYRIDVMECQDLCHGMTGLMSMNERIDFSEWQDRF